MLSNIIIFKEYIFCKHNNFILKNTPKLTRKHETIEYNTNKSYGKKPAQPQFISITYTSTTITI